MNDAEFESVFNEKLRQLERQSFKKGYIQALKDLSKIPLTSSSSDFHKVLREFCKNRETNGRQKTIKQEIE